LDAGAVFLKKECLPEVKRDCLNVMYVRLGMSHSDVHLFSLFDRHLMSCIPATCAR
jgi:hypothetical protein